MSPVKILNFIDGNFHEPESKSFIDSFNPSTGQVFSQVPNSGPSEVNLAVEAAKESFKKWSRTPVNERCRILLKVADIIESKLEEFAQAESGDQGKPLWLSRSVDIPRSVVNFRHFAQSAKADVDMAISQPEDGVLNYTVQTPVGVVAVISPWNFPLYLLTFKLAPALVYGNTIVAKPSEFTSTTAFMLCQVFQEAGLPDGVVNMIFGYGHNVGEPLVCHPDVRLVSFTGSTRTGTRIAQVTAPQAKRLSLEMGGKNAAVIFEDADLDKAANTLIRGAFMNSGQVCLCTSRIFVHRSVYSDFEKKYVELAKNVVVGPSTKEGVYMGPVNNEMQLNKIKGYLDIAKSEGAKFLIGSEQNLELPVENQNGFFVSPVILTDLKPGSRLMKEEIFGPVTCLQIFGDEDEAISRVNETDYGLCAAIFSNDVSRIHRVAPQLDVGTVWCNCWMVRNLHLPFGGAKMSGIGREGTKYSREFYTETKTICLKL